MLTYRSTQGIKLIVTINSECNTTFLFRTVSIMTYHFIL